MRGIGDLRVITRGNVRGTVSGVGESGPCVRLRVCRWAGGQLQAKKRPVLNVQ